MLQLGNAMDVTAENSVLRTWPYTVMFIVVFIEIFVSNMEVLKREHDNNTKIVKNLSGR
jgi:multisubunit Na+/H+ antiporter MnhE subunit